MSPLRFLTDAEADAILQAVKGGCTNGPNSTILGAAGEYFVMSQLLRRT